MLLNAIKILPAHLLSRTAYLKLPKSLNVGIVIVIADALSLAEKKALCIPVLQGGVIDLLFHHTGYVGHRDYATDGMGEFMPDAGTSASGQRRTCNRIGVLEFTAVALPLQPVSPMLDRKPLDSEHNNEPFLRFPETYPHCAALWPVAAD